MLKKIFKSEDEWMDILDSNQYRIMRMRKTEPAFSGEYLDAHEEGAYRCAACGNILFSSDDKYDSGTGWPSFSNPIDLSHIVLGIFSAYGTEVMCAQCEAHLGHVFDDGPIPSGKRYCINSISLKLDTSTKEYVRKISDEDYYGTPS